MNSFFASCEQQDNLAWRGKPVGVCEHLGGIIIAASVEAKRWGIKTGTPVWEAKKLFPKIILSHTHPSQYRLYSRRLTKLAGDYTGLVQQASIDEVYLDVTRVCNIKKVNSDQSLVDSNPFVEAVSIAREIKRRMKTEVGDWLTCSVGIGENKILAKIGSNLQKPNGLVVIREDVIFPTLKADDIRPYGAGCHSGIPLAGTSKAECPESRPQLTTGSPPPLKLWRTGRTFFAGTDNPQSNPPKADRDDTAAQVPLVFCKNDLYRHLKLTDIPGIGRRQEKNLNQLGIKTLLDLKNYPKSRLVARFGIHGHHLHNLGRLEGSFDPEVAEDTDIKSIGHMYTLPKEYREKKFFVPVLYKLSEMVGKRLRKQEMMGNIIHFYLRDKNYEGWGQSKKLAFYLYDGREIFLECMKIFQAFSLSPGQFYPHTKTRSFFGHESKSTLNNSIGSIDEPNSFGVGVKLIGVTVAGLTHYLNQLSLFGTEERKRRVAEALDSINQKYGDFTVCRVPVLAAGKVFKDSIGFGRIKENIKPFKA